MLLVVMHNPELVDYRDFVDKLYNLHPQEAGRMVLRPSMLLLNRHSDHYISSASLLMYRCNLRMSRHYTRLMCLTRAVRNMYCRKTYMRRFQAVDLSSPRYSCHLFPILYRYKTM